MSLLSKSRTFEDFARCPICFEVYKDNSPQVPLVLHCAHTFCHSCITGVPLHGRKAVACPICRELTPLFGTWDTLKRNFALLDLLQFLTSEPRVVKCAENESHVAAFTCGTCRVDLCEACWGSSHTASFQRMHVKRNVSEVVHNKPMNSAPATPSRPNGLSRLLSLQSIPSSSETNSETSSTFTTTTTTSSFSNDVSPAALSPRIQQTTDPQPEYSSPLPGNPYSPPLAYPSEMRRTMSGLGRHRESVTYGAPGNPARKLRVKAVSDFTGQEEGDLTFKKNDVISVSSIRGDWWTGEFNGVSGRFPSSTVAVFPL